MDEDFGEPLGWSMEDHKQMMKQIAYTHVNAAANSEASHSQGSASDERYETDDDASTKECMEVCPLQQQRPAVVEMGACEQKAEVTAADVTGRQGVTAEQEMTAEQGITAEQLAREQEQVQTHHVESETLLPTDSVHNLRSPDELAAYAESIKCVKSAAGSGQREN